MHFEKILSQILDKSKRQKNLEHPGRFHRFFFNVYRQLCNILQKPMWRKVRKRLKVEHGEVRLVHKAKYFQFSRKFR